MGRAQGGLQAAGQGAGRRASAPVDDAPLCLTGSRYQELGLDDGSECECCGKTNLKRRVILGVLDADGNTMGEIYVGVDCAERLTKIKARVIGQRARSAQHQTDARRELDMGLYDDPDQRYNRARLMFHHAMRAAGHAEGDYPVSWPVWLNEQRTSLGLAPVTREQMRASQRPDGGETS